MSKTTREKILDATIGLLWQHSYGSVSVDAICHAANVQKGSFYHYFPSKVDVVLSAFEREWDAGRAQADRVFSCSLAPLERLSAYCDFAYEKQKRMHDTHGKVLGCPYMTCGMEMSTLEERVRQTLEDMFDRAARYFETLLRDAKAEGLTDIADPAIGAREMMACVAGVMYQAKLKNDLEVIRRDLHSGLLRFFTPPRDMRHAQPDHSVNELVLC